jgi:hypothetical protein
MNLEKQETKMPPPRIITLVEHIQIQINTISNNFKSGTQVNHEDLKKNFLKHFD